MNDLIVNVFGWEYGSLTIYHTDKNLYQTDQKIVNLLLYKSHYVWIKNITHLTRSLNKHMGVKTDV